ncbi:TPA: pantothenic acid transporter pant, partial [Streptococcus suis]
AMLATVLGTNSIAEMIISSVLTAALVPTLQKIQK